MSEATEQPTENLPTSLTRQLIAYIGNKRRLLPFLAPILNGLSRSGAPRFLDPMSGSGAVSRLARHLGFTVSANDWEEFAHVVTAASVENTEVDLSRLFDPHGGLDRVLRELDDHGWATVEGDAGEDEPGYIATHFAPQSTANPRIGRERLFYTAENARFLDRVRDRIDTLFPAADADAIPRDGSSDTDRVRRVLIALLLYEASNHANTSGVFKAYHRGFGGHGRDALPRILSSMHLEHPAVIDGPAGDACNEDAFLFVKGRTAEICYLDPPYNSHQYGSNYFMLNTIARWDKQPVNADRDKTGSLVAKAGIRPDWTDTRSAFCYKETASRTFARLIDRIDAGALVVSYSPSGFIAPEEMADLLAPHGELTLHGTNYAAYRGGRQSLTRASSAQELVFVVRRRAPRVAAGAQCTFGFESTDRAAARVREVSSVARQLAEWKVHELLRGPFVPQRVREEFSTGRGEVLLTESVTVPTIDFYRLDGHEAEFLTVSDADLRHLAARLERARCADHEEEFRTVLSLIRSADGGTVDRALKRRLLTCLRRYAHRKYRQQFWDSVAVLQAEIDRRPTDLGGISPGLSRIVNQARSRFGE